MRGRTMAAVGMLVAATLGAGPAQASEHTVVAAGMFAVQPPSRAAFHEPLLGPSITLGVFEDRTDTWRIRPGFAIQLGTAFDAEGLWLADAFFGFVGTLGLTDKAANPFVALGADAAWVAAGRAEGAALGVRGDLGIHGVVLDWLYWRAQVGWVAAGIGGLRSEITVGHAFM